MQAKIPRNIYVTKVLEVGKQYISAFAVRANDQGWKDKADSWAKEKFRWDQRVQILTQDIRPNFSQELKLVSYQVREGGVVYKVVTTDNLLYDLRKDVVWSTIMQEGIEKGGKLNGKFVLAHYGSQARWILVGSELYNNAIVE